MSVFLLPKDDISDVLLRIQVPFGYLIPLSGRYTVFLCSCRAWQRQITLASISYGLLLKLAVPDLEVPIISILFYRFFTTSFICSFDSVPLLFGRLFLYVC